MSNETVKNPNRIAVIDDYPRLKLRYDTWKKLYRATHDRWPAFFGTKEHKRRDKRCTKMAERFVAEVRKEFNIEKWDVRYFHRGIDSPVIVYRDPWVAQEGEVK